MADSGRRTKHVSKACHLCRSRRNRCDGANPCGRCEQKGVACVYDEGRDKRSQGPPSKAFVASLQDRIALLEAQLIRLNVTPDEGPAMKDEAGSSYSMAGPSTSTARLPPASSTLALDKQSGTLRYLGLSNTLGSEMAAPSGTAPTPQRPDFSFLPEGLSFQLGLELVDNAFAYFYTAHKIVDRPSFMTELGRGTRTHAYSPFLHLALLAVGSRYTANAPQICSDPADPGTRGMPFFQRARAMVDQELEAPLLSTIRGLLMLSEYMVGIGKIATAWLFAGLGMRCCQDLGLNIDSGEMQISPALRAARTDCFWAALCDDVHWSVLMGRTSTFRASDIFQELPPRLQLGPGGVELGNADATFHWNAALQIIGSRVIHNLYSYGALQRGQASLKKEAALLAKAMSDFYDELPHELRLTPSSMEAAAISNVLALNLNFHLFTMLIHRPFYPTSAVAADSASQRMCDEAAQLVFAMLRHFRDRVGMTRAPLNIIHIIFIAGTIALRSLEQQVLLQQSASTGMADLLLCQTCLSEIGQVWPGALIVAKGLSKLVGESGASIGDHHGVAHAGETHGHAVDPVLVPLPEQMDHWDNLFPDGAQEWQTWPTDPSLYASSTTLQPFGYLF